ncbi:MAG: type II secretion system protein GspF [Deltaproteobacteria bacterium CG23_combo_of_CG06-09_8_20_14_all_51_20]|nr:MAG: type II secretion system protein GspF [Deltaproteobacteria bacterium CG23_combo_of_CG06-09_8_20_14_all_51_20]
MQTFTYKATDSTGKVISGTLEAFETKDALARLQDMGYIPIRITSAGGRRWLDADLSKILSLFQRVSTKDVVNFTQDLSTLLGAGLPVDRALAILINVADNEKFKDIIKDILKTVRGGSYLSDALSKHPRVFSTFYVNMVRAGEVGSVLESVLYRLSIFLENSQDLRDYIRSSMVYPLFLVFVGGISIIVLLTFVVPKFSLIFSDMGQTVPVTARFLLGLSDVLRNYWFVILGGLGAIYYFFRRYTSTPAGRLKMDQYKMRLPVSGEFVRKVEVARFARTLGTLTNSGVPILQALKLVTDIVGNQVIARSMTNVYNRVKEGERLSKPLGDMGVFPSLAIQIITVGEETGKLDEMLLRVAENYEKMVRNMVRKFISLLEPAMILAMGLIVGFIVISMLMAIFSINEMPF